MPYCEKCGNRMSDDALFCSKCGRKVGLHIISKPVKESINTTDKNQSVSIEAIKEEKYATGAKRLNKRIIVLTAVLLTMIAIGCFLFFIFRNDKVVIENEDGDNVFAFTFSEFVDRYNEENADLMPFRDFDKEAGDDTYCWSEDEFTVFVSIDKGNDPCCVTDISLFIYDDKKVPSKAVGIMRAIFTDMSEEEAYDYLEEVLSEGSIDIDNVEISIEDVDGEQWWKFRPSWVTY